jgi:hypothetical protein
VANWNTLRNQMLAGFISVMIIVLVCAGAITFNSVSTLLNTKAETQMKQIASYSSEPQRKQASFEHPRSKLPEQIGYGVLYIVLSIVAVVPVNRGFFAFLSSFVHRRCAQAMLQ